jgi:hypothetical protein
MRSKRNWVGGSRFSLAKTHLEDGGRGSHSEYGSLGEIPSANLLASPEHVPTSSVSESNLPLHPHLHPVLVLLGRPATPMVCFLCQASKNDAGHLHALRQRRRNVKALDRPFYRGHDRRGRDTASTDSPERSAALICAGKTERMRAPVDDGALVSRRRPSGRRRVWPPLGRFALRSPHDRQGKPNVRPRSSWPLRDVEKMCPFVLVE